MTTEISLTLRELPDSSDNIARFDQSSLRLLGAAPGDIVAITGERTTYAVAAQAYMEDRNQGVVRVNPNLRKNCVTMDGRAVKIAPLHYKPDYAEQVSLILSDDIDYLHLLARLKQLNVIWQDRVLIEDDFLRVPTLDRHDLIVKVSENVPRGPVRIGPMTQFSAPRDLTQILTNSLAGLRDIYRMCHALAMRRLFSEVASTAHAVLLTGPAGCGKARLVKRLAEEMRTTFRVLDAHVLFDRQATHGSIDLDSLLSDLAPLTPAIILLDNLESLRDHPAHQAVITQLCSILDDLRLRKGIMLFGVCSGTADQRFLSDQRFDLVLTIDAPDKMARLEMLLLATRNLPLDATVDLSRLASATRGCSMADIQRLVSAAELSGTSAVLSSDDFSIALRSVTPSAQAQVFCDMPNVEWDDVGGLDEVKALLRETISWSLDNSRKFSDAKIMPPKSILLSGSHGTGKTLLVRAIASITPLNFIEISCPAFKMRDADTALKYIYDSFALARRKTPSLIFFDDIDVLFSDFAANDDQQALSPVISQILTELDRLTQIDGVIVIATTNRPDRLSNEMMRPGRFDYAITLPMPDHASRKKILQIHARKLPLAADVDFDKLASMTQGLSPADITNMCNRVGLLALRHSLNNDSGVIPPVVDAALFEQVLRGRKP